MIKYLVVLALCGNMMAQQLPSAPKPKAISHTFLNKGNVIAISASFGLRTLDGLYTCDLIDKGTEVIGGYSYTFHETTLPFHSCKNIMISSEVIAAAGVGISFLLHKAGAHRFEAFTNWSVAAGGAYGFLINKIRTPKGF